MHMASRVQRICTVFCFVGCVLSLQAVAFGLEGERPSTAASDADKVRFALAALKTERLKLTSGICRFTGSLVIDFKGQPEGTFDGPVKGFIAFDRDKLRYDISRPDWIVDPASITQSNRGAAQDGQVTSRTIKGILTKCFANDGTRATVWVSGEPLIAISQAHEMPNVIRGDYFDIRCPTIFDRLAMNKGLTLDQVFGNFTEHLAKFSQQVEHPDAATWLLNWTAEHPDGKTTWSLALDVEKAFVPKQFKCETVRRQNKPGTKILEWEISADWLLRDGVWVPEHYAYHQFVGPFSGVDEKKTLDFKWEQVNQAVDPQLFNYQTFQVSDEVAVQDVSSGTPVWIKPLPKGQGFMGTSLPGTAEPLQPRSKVVWIIAVNVAFLLVFLIVAWRRKAAQDRH